MIQSLFLPHVRPLTMLCQFLCDKCFHDLSGFDTREAYGPDLVPPIALRTVKVAAQQFNLFGSLLTRHSKRDGVCAWAKAASHS